MAKMQRCIVNPRCRSVLFLDPHVKHLQRLGASAAKPGAKLNFAKKDLKSVWPDQPLLLQQVELSGMSPWIGSCKPKQGQPEM